MDPRQHDMGSHVANDMGIVSDVGRAWIGCPSIGFDERFRSLALLANSLHCNGASAVEDRPAVIGEIA